MTAESPRSDRLQRLFLLLAALALTALFLYMIRGFAVAVHAVRLQGVSALGLAKHIGTSEQAVGIHWPSYCIACSEEHLLFLPPLESRKPATVGLMTACS